MLKLCLLPVLLSGCVFSSELKKSEGMMKNFECTNIENNQIPHNSVTSYFESSLYSSKQKASTYIENYKNGEKDFDIPLHEVIEQQFVVYKEACQNLGGIIKNP